MKKDLQENNIWRKTTTVLNNGFLSFDARVWVGGSGWAVEEAPPFSLKPSHEWFFGGLKKTDFLGL